MTRMRLYAVGGLATLLGLYTIYWFIMAGQIKQELAAWVEDQAAEGTIVTYDGVKVSGFPLSLKATVQQPDIFVQEGDRQPHWHGEYLAAKTRPYSLRSIKIEFEGTQTITFLDEWGGELEPPQEIAMTFDGASMTMDLKLANGKIEQADVNLQELVVSTQETQTDQISLNPFPENMIVEQVHIHSQVSNAPPESTGSIAHDFTLLIENLATDRNPPNGFSNEVKRIEIDITRTSDEMVGFHNGSLKVERQKTASDAKDVAIRKARFEWDPIIIDLSGDLRAPPQRDFSGKALLAIKGHRDLIRVLTEEGELSSLAAVLSGALVGALEMMGTANEDGTIEIPLNIDDGDVKFLFLPLTDLDELREAAGRS